MRVRKNRNSKTRTFDKPAAIAGQEYRVGPGHPPKEFQFRPGQSGNPKGARRKRQTATPDLKLLLQRELAKKIRVKRPGGEIVQSMSAAGIEKLVADFANGSRHARRDLLILAEKIGVDLAAGHENAITGALDTVLSATDQALVDDFFRRKLAEHEQSLRKSDDTIVQASEGKKTNKED